MPRTPQQVTTFLRQVADELEALEAAKAEIEQLRGDVRSLRQERDELAHRLEASSDPIAAVGLEVENVLRATRELADEIQERARVRAANLVAEAAEAAAAALTASHRLRTGAEMDAAEIISRAWRQSADLVVRQAGCYEEQLTAERDGTSPPAADPPVPPPVPEPAARADLSNRATIHADPIRA